MAPAHVLPLLLLNGAIWGLTPALAKIAMGWGVPPLAVAFWAALGSGLMLFALCRARGFALPLSRAHLGFYLASGLSGFALANLAGYHALQHVPVGFFALVVPLAPMLTVLGAALFGLERLTTRRVAGTALGFGGVALAMAPGAALPDAAAIGWAFVAALSPLCYAAANIVAVRLAPFGTAPLPAATGALFGATLGLGLFGWLFGQFHLPLAGAQAADALLLAQAVLTALAYVCYFLAIARAGAVVTSQVGYIATIAGIAWGALLLGERMGWLTLPAGALIFAGLWLVTRRG